MENVETWEIKGHTLEYLDGIHQYVVDGLCVPSITQILKVKFSKKYEGVDVEVLNKAAEAGTRVHQAIEDYEKWKIDDISCQELRDYKFLKKAFKFKCLDNEVPVILFKDDKPIAAGRLDLVLELESKKGLGDIKRTSTLDKEYLAYQLNLYRIAYQQCYGVKIEFLRGLHLRKGTRKFVELPINEMLAWKLVEEYLKVMEV